RRREWSKPVHIRHAAEPAIGSRCAAHKQWRQRPSEMELACGHGCRVVSPAPAEAQSDSTNRRGYAKLYLPRSWKTRLSSIERCFNKESLCFQDLFVISCIGSKYLQGHSSDE